MAQIHRSLFLGPVITWGGCSCKWVGPPPQQCFRMQAPSISHLCHPSPPRPRPGSFSASKPAKELRLQRRHACFSKALVQNWHISLLLTSHWGEVVTATSEGWEKVVSGWAAARATATPRCNHRIWNEGQISVNNQLSATTPGFFFLSFSHSYLSLSGMPMCIYKTHGTNMQIIKHPWGRLGGSVG